MMNLQRARAAALWLGLVGLALLSASQAEAQVGAERYPQRPIRVVVPYPAGGGLDVISRVIGERLGRQLGQAVVIDNKPGGGTILGADFVAKAAPDGYTLIMTTDST